MKAVRPAATSMLLFALVSPALFAKEEKGPPKFQLEDLECTTYMKNGPPEEKVDIVIVGDGFTKEDYTRTFTRYVKNPFMAIFFRTRPFERFNRYFNVHGIKTLSFDSGAETQPGEDLRRNIFNCTYGTSGTDRLLTVQDEDALRKAIRSAPDCDILFVMVNDTRRGGSGGTLRVSGAKPSVPLGVFSIGDGSVHIAIHELGHSFAHLADEYADPQVATSHPLPAQGDLKEANVTLGTQFDNTSEKNMRDTIKWKHFFKHGKGTFWIGAYEGAYYRDKGVFRPSARCKMLDSETQDFCYVCQEELVKAIFACVGEEFVDEGYHRKFPMR
jgi:hypothetical protein